MVSFYDHDDLGAAASQELLSPDLLPQQLLATRIEVVESRSCQDVGLFHSLYDWDLHCDRSPVSGSGKVVDLLCAERPALRPAGSVAMRTRTWSGSSG